MPREYALSACRWCGFVFADTPAPQSTYDRYYAEASKYTGAGTGISETDATRFAGIAEHLAAHFPPNARIADVGSGNGGLVGALRTAGFTEITGIDPSVDCAQRIGGHVGSLWDLPPIGADCLVLSHVLEHVRDVGRAIRSLRDAAPTVYVEVPDATRYTECMVAPFQDINVEHINHFSTTSLSNALALGGFVVTATGTKTIESAPGMPYPAVWAIAHRGEPDGVIKDTATAIAMRQYIERSRGELLEIDARLRRRIEPNADLLLWGTGQTVLTVWPDTVLAECTIHALIDSSPTYQGRRINGVPVIAPDALARYPHPIVIGSVIHERAIRARIRDLGAPNQLLSLA